MSLLIEHEGVRYCAFHWIVSNLYNVTLGCHGAMCAYVLTVDIACFGRALLLASEVDITCRLERDVSVV